MIKFNIVRYFGWMLLMLSTLLAGWVLYDSVVLSQSPQQQLAGGVLACALVLIPLAFAKAIEKLLP